MLESRKKLTFFLTSESHPLQNLHFVAFSRSESPGIGAEAGKPSTGADRNMISIQSKSKMCTDTIARLGELVESWRGWNVLCAVNEQPRNEQEDIAHALAVEGRDQSGVFTALRIFCYLISSR